MDSIPFQAVADRYARGEFEWFDPPQKGDSAVSIAERADFFAHPGRPAAAGDHRQYYDPETAQISSGVWKRVSGYHQPWEFRTNYSAKYWEAGLSYMEPQPWYQVELMRSKEALDKSRIAWTIVYLVSALGHAVQAWRSGTK